MAVTGPIGALAEPLLASPENEPSRRLLAALLIALTVLASLCIGLCFGTPRTTRSVHCPRRHCLPQTAGPTPPPQPPPPTGANRRRQQFCATPPHHRHHNAASRAGTPSPPPRPRPPGWASFASILEEEGVYSEACGGAPTPCAAQIVLLTSVYTAATSCIVFGGLPAGLLIDRIGPYWAAGSAGSLVSAGLLAIGLLPADAGHQFFLPFVALGVGGVITFFTAFRVASLFPSHMTVLLTAVNVLFDISATVPLFAFLLYHNSGFTRHAIFTPYAGYVAVVYATWIGVWSVYNRSAAPAPLLQQSGAAPAALTDKGEPLGSPPLASEGEAGGAEGRAAGSGDAGSPADGGGDGARASGTTGAAIAPIDEGVGLWRAVRSRQFGVGMLWFVAHQWRSNLYLCEVKYMLRDLGDRDERFMAYFSALLGLALQLMPKLGRRDAIYNVTSV